MKQMTKAEIESQALQIAVTEKSRWETTNVQVTERVSFDIRNLIRQCRKNYYSVFTKEYDELTGRKKTFVPLTESTVESVVKNTDLDTKDIGFRARKQEAIGLTAIIRSIVLNNLDRIYFGEKLDELVRNLAIDGTVVWKTIVNKDDEDRDIADAKKVDLLNFYIDPNADSIKETPAVIERIPMLVDEVKKETDWINTEDIVGSTNVPDVDSDVMASTKGETPFVEVFERWGLLPKKLLTGNPEDKEEIMTRLVFSEDGGGRIHLIEKAKKKPYEELRYTRVPNRWYGRGVAEKLISLQSYINAIVNIRKNRAYLAQMGIFKIKKNRGITPQQLSRLPSNGAILVDSMDDIEQFVMSEASNSSYADENNIRDWATRATQTFESVTGETLPASATATSAAISSRAGQSYFVFIKEGMGLFLQRWLKRQHIPLIMETIKEGEMIQIIGDPKELEELDKLDIMSKASVILADMNKKGIVIDMEGFQAEIERRLEARKKQGKQRFSKFKKLNVTDFDVQVQVTNEDMDKGVMIQNLTAALNVAPEFKDQIIKNMFDLMGLDFKEQPFTPEQTGANAPIPGQSATDLTTGANTMEPNIRQTMAPNIANG
jgi:hypothetical protein